MPDPTDPAASRSRFRAIVTDVHFWIPLGVLIAGLLLLGKVS